MTPLRCDKCAHLKQGFCNKLGEELNSRLAKLFFGGAVELFSGTQTYPSECGIEKEKSNKTHITLEIFTVENLIQQLP